MTKEEIVKMAVESVREYDRKQAKSRTDRRLRNTKLLLENYSLLRDHCVNAIYDKSRDIETFRVVDVLDELERCDDKDLYIESIKKSTVRTRIILKHIDEMLSLYKTFCSQSKQTEDQRRYRIFDAYYFEGATIEEIIQREAVAERTVYRDMEVAREKLSALIFGIDGLYSAS